LSNKWLELKPGHRCRFARACGEAAGSGESANSTSATRRLHHLAVQIHPFLNGNGRWSRMLANIRQRSAPVSRRFSPITEWPEQVIGRESPVRGEYLQAIRAADKGDYELLFELHRRFTASG